MKTKLGYYQQILYDLLPPGFFIKTYRLSQAALGSCEWGPYYGIVACQVRRGSTVPLVVKALERAGREYRSLRKAEAEADTRFTDRIRMDLIGRVSDSDAEVLLSMIFDPDVEDPLIYFGADKWLRDSIGAKNSREAIQKFGLDEKIRGAEALLKVI